MTTFLHLLMADDKVRSFSAASTDKFKVWPAQGMRILLKSSLSDLIILEPLSVVKQETCSSKSIDHVFASFLLW